MAFFIFRASASVCLGISHPALGEEEEESSCQWQKGAWSGRCWKIWVHLPGHFQKKKKRIPSIHPSSPWKNLHQRGLTDHSTGGTTEIVFLLMRAFLVRSVITTTRVVVLLDFFGEKRDDGGRYGCEKPRERQLYISPVWNDLVVRQV